MSVTTEASAAEIRPFRVATPQAELEALRDRITATRRPHKELVEDRSQGVQSATINKLADYWSSEYDWRQCESKLNALSQFKTEIDGVDIHFIHAQSPHPDALPLIMTHGWPRLGHRAARRRRPAHRPDRAWRTRRGRVRPRTAVPARLRFLRRAGRSWLGSRPRRARLGGVDAPPRLQPLRCSGWRQHHSVLADGHRSLGRPVVLGERTSCRWRRRPCSRRGLDSGRLHDVPGRDLPSPAQLGRERVPEPHVLQ
jgi:Epoxide hydrolase N terminus